MEPTITTATALEPTCDTLPTRDRAGVQNESKSGGACVVVSIIIPAYNAAPYIRKTLQAVFAQTFADYEVIVINDGSPDTQAFEHAIEPYQERIRYIRQPNGGASAARNAGLRASRGELIAFLDADDMWSPNYLEEQLKFINEQRCDVVCADARITGDSPDAEKTYMQAVMAAAPASGRVTFLQLLSGDRSLITSGVLARRDLILEVGLFDLTLRNAQDFDLWLRLARHGARLAYQRKVLLEYCCRHGSLSGDAINSHRREIRVLEKVEQRYVFAPQERAEVSTVIRERKALLSYELGKLYLLPGDFARARESFAQSNSLRRALKPTLALWLTRLMPNLMKSLYARRAGIVTARVPPNQEVAGI